jgi:hypothetical protein
LWRRSIVRVLRWRSLLWNALWSMHRGSLHMLREPVVRVRWRSIIRVVDGWTWHICVAVRRLRLHMLLRNQRALSSRGIS